jgi:hypothetical protein
MELDFDKEIDALLRRTAQSETAFAADSTMSAHLDADEIAAFAENALPEKSRQRYILHFADCGKCRKNLSNLIALNSETESEIVHQEEKQIASLPVPWYRKLFLFPNLAYTLGALVIVFAGIAAFTVLQSVNNSGNLEVSQVSERQTGGGGKGMSSDGDAIPQEVYPNSSGTMSSNTSAMNTNSSSMSSNTMTTANSSNFPTPASPVLMANSNVSTREEADKNLKDAPKPSQSAKETLDLAKTESQSVTTGAPLLTTPAPTSENNFQEMEPVRRQQQQQQNQTQNSIAQNQTQIMPDSRNVQRAPSATSRSDIDKAKKLGEGKDDAALDKSNATTAAGGKIFKRQNNVWYDSAYRGQATTNFTRGTKEYKKLDSGLREIAERIGGTIVIVWKEKAYRIQ